MPDTECAGLQVPVDYAKPDGAKITLRLARAPAVDPAKRKGVLLLLPGGPGVGIMEIMGGEMREAQHVAEFQQQYDVVTFDPRGIGKSSPIRCDPAAAPKAEMPLDHKPTQAEFEAVARANAAFIESCADASGELLWHLSAKDTAQDIERIRQALSPNDGIVAYGASYGSAYGGRLSRSLSAEREGADPRRGRRSHRRLRHLHRAQRDERAGCVRALCPVVRARDQMRAAWQRSGRCVRCRHRA